MKPKKAIHVEIGEDIKRAREQAGFIQERFAEMIGLGPKSLSAIERGASGISLSALRRSPAQYKVACDVMYKLLEAFSLPTG